MEVEREGILFECDGWAEEEVVDVVDFDAVELEEPWVFGGFLFLFWWVWWFVFHLLRLCMSAWS